MAAKKPVEVPTVKLCVQPMPKDFDSYLIAEMQKQALSLLLVMSDGPSCDRAKSDYVLSGVLNDEGTSRSGRSFGA